MAGSVSSAVDGAARAGSDGQSAGLARLRGLPEDVGGLVAVGVLSFAGPTGKGGNQVGLDLMCTDSDGRAEVVKLTAFSQWQDGSPTALGQLLMTGELAKLVGSEVACAVRVRAKDGIVYYGAERLWELSRTGR